MINIQDILFFYKSRGCTKIVLTSDVAFILDSISCEQKNGLTINVMDDVRSATFFAYGEAKITQTPALLIVKNYYLTNCYTGLTEAWFQQIPLIVISLTKNENSVYYDYLTSCICKGLTLKSNDFEEYKSDLEVSLSAFGPTLINLIMQFPDRKYDSCKKVLNVLNSSLEKEDTVICYGDLSLDLNYKFKILLVDESNKYGIISKYMGSLLGCNGNCYLIAPLELFKYDTNIFNNRYINNRFKVLFINDGDNSINPQKWVENNNIQFKVINALTLKEVETFIFTDNPAVMVLNFEEE